MNLINETWLPICRKNGTCEQITPWQITENINTNPVERLNAPRPDFNGALVQFCIGILQTAFAPKDDYEWMTLYQSPPDAQMLEKAFFQYEHAFNADGDGPRFMQDYDLPEEKPKKIGSLLIEEPGVSTKKDNKDHFIKRGNAEVMEVSTAITALLTLQMNAPPGGSGNRVSIRGGGPLTTLLAPDTVRNPQHNTLWHLVWLNVLPKNEFEHLCGNPDLQDEVSIFPWLGPTRTSDKEGRSTTPEDVHPLQVYWSMPRRIRLDFTEADKGLCSLSGKEAPLVHHYTAKNCGIDYCGPWRHPLSPYRFDNQGMSLPLHLQPDGLGYRHWLGLVLGDQDSVTPAAIVHYHLKSSIRHKINTQLWAFGYDMDKMKARGWHEAHLPLFHLEEQDREAFTEMIRDILNATSMVGDNLRGALKKAWFKPKAKIKGDLSFIVNSFWQNTEPDFYSLLAQLHSVVTQEKDETPLYHAWFNTINNASFTLFDTAAVSGNIEDEDPKRIALARRDLRKFNNKKAIRSALRLDITIKVKDN